ncbi:hypothetical protein [Actinacidiphila bryophytorum]|uniref:Uncharacterized protein n=1 Tax=Actinacidiphila bryophytorum TaxID=1436133 RepID=A0A9W4MCC3_9ACTN|nr:hypothetical protein [Actinacidiphila bryophytorum]MBM9440145.1 hypothetical protein [Actinacidiphila bryophytorum]MBN6541805.1 hypothetical protein [Actinacidiphila bryophytorum]CAG7644920.1 hypothetical protein SBRY_40023 [Actinacidiphila bryophytorum]
MTASALPVDDPVRRNLWLHFTDCSGDQGDRVVQPATPLICGPAEPDEIETSLCKVLSDVAQQRGAGRHVA